MITCTNCGFQIQGDYKFCPSCGSQMIDSPGADESLLGRTLNQKYRMVSEIGSGSMGTVYLAEHIGLKKRVAIKVLRTDLQVSEESLRRFQREGIAAGKFTHPGAIQIFDFDRSEDQTCFLAMEYVQGTTLKAMIGREGRLPPETAVDIARQVLSVLEEAHKEGIIHRDLKPENIMVVGTGNGDPLIKVLDFGLSKLVDLPGEDSIRTQVGRIIGSPRYMAPEQCDGSVVDHRIDLYATGLILYEMLAGESPFKGDNLTEIIMKRISEPAPSIAGNHPELQVPADLEEFIQKALQKDPDDRFQSASEMIAALDGVGYSRIAKAPARRPDRSRRPDPGKAGDRARQPRRFSARALMGGLATIVLAAVAVWVIAGMGRSGPEAEPPLVSMKSPEDRTELENRYVGNLQEARSRLRNREFDVALAAVEEAIPLECADGEAYLVRGLIYLRRGDLDMAVADFEEALKVQEGYAAAAAGQGWVHLEKEDFQPAMEHFDEALRMNDRCAEALAGQGAVHYLRGDRPNAKTLLKGAVEIDATLPLAHFYLGKTLLDDGDLDGAIDGFIQAKRHDSKFPEAFIGLGEIYERRGELDQAERQFQDALKLDPASLAARTALAVHLVERGRFADARPVIEEGIQRHSGAGRLHVLLGVALEADGRVGEAITSVRKGVELDAGDPEARILLGILLQRQGNVLEAVEQYEAAAEIDGSSPVPFLNEGLALYSLDRFEEAADAFAKAVTIDTQNAFAYYNLGVLYKDYLERADLAIEYFRQFEKAGGLDAEQNRKVRQWLENQGY